MLVLIALMVVAMFLCSCDAALFKSKPVATVDMGVSDRFERLEDAIINTSHTVSSEIKQNDPWPNVLLLFGIWVMDRIGSWTMKWFGRQ